MRLIPTTFIAIVALTSLSTQPLSSAEPTKKTTPKIQDPKQMTLVWSDEFDRDGTPDERFWSFEQGFVRNQEPQWYQADNAVCRDGLLVIEAREEVVENPKYDPQSTDWKLNRKTATYTSSSIITKGKFDFKFGRIEIRAKIPTDCGAWPAIWTKGVNMEWPFCGEIDILEFYRKGEQQSIWANVAWGGDKRHTAVWNTVTIPYTHFTDRDPDWAGKFHVWAMDWDENFIRLYLDDELLNETKLSKTVNGSFGNATNPFHQPHFILLNLALKDTQWDNPKKATLPFKYEVDYVRVYQ